MRDENIMKTQEIGDTKKKSIQKWPKVAIIILNWNGWKDTIECLESVFRNTYPNYQVIVVDNDSTDGSMNKIKAWAEGKQEVLTPEISHPLYYLSHPSVEKPIPYIYYTREEAERGGDSTKEEEVISNWKNKDDKLPLQYPLILIQTGENLGYAGGNNAGIKFALNRLTNYICILNNDVIVENNFLRIIISKMEYDKSIGIAGPILCDYYNYEIVQSTGAKINLYTGQMISFNDGINKNICKKNLIVDYIGGACLVIREDLIHLIGMIPEVYFIFFEETEWCIKVQKKGYKIMCVWKSTVYHKLSKSINKLEEIQEYYKKRNKIIFEKRNANIIQLFIFYIYEVLRTAKNIISRKVDINILKGFKDGFLFKNKSI